MALDIGSLVDFLANEGQVHLPDVGQELWPTFDPSRQDAYPMDWDRFFGGEAQAQGIVDDGLLADLEGTIGRRPADDERAAEMSGRRPEICAWYQPIHFHGFEWGIFVYDHCIQGIVFDIARFLTGPVVLSLPTLLLHLQRSAFYTLFLHEAAHHKTESLAVRLHVVERTPCYHDYWSKVYVPAATGGHGAHEEAIANADSYRRLTEATYAGRVDKQVRQATREYLKTRFPHDPAGYCDAVHYLAQDAYECGVNLLEAQVQEAQARPFRALDQWALAPNMNEGLFGIRSDIWVIVDRGGRPTSLPVFPLYRPVAGRKLEAALAREYGYKRAKGGKGSHVRLRADGYPPLTLPGDRKDLSPVVLKNAASALGLKGPGELLERLGL